MIKYLTKIGNKKVGTDTNMTMARTFKQFITPQKYSQVMIDALDIQDPEKVIDLTMGEKDNIDAISVIGDSMYPTIKEDSIIFIDKNKTDITGGGIFVINLNDHLLIKRVALNSCGGFDLIPDNKNYIAESVPFEEATIVGRVIGLGRGYNCTPK